MLYGPVSIFCEYFLDGYNFAILSTHREILKPCIKDGLLAPTPQQRLTYQKWQLVYGRMNASLPGIVAQMADDYKV